MPSTPGRASVVAHVIVGARPEPYLPATLAAIADFCSHAVINDNSGLPDSPNAAAIGRARFAAEDRLTLLRTSFVDFAQARNACIDATPEPLRAGWALRVDADEVFDDSLLAVARLPAQLGDDVDAIDGYSRHFVGSFDYFDEIARQLCLFRLDRDLRWMLPVHEKLDGLRNRVALPLALFHYGHVVPPVVEEQRGWLYASLAQTSTQSTRKDATQADVPRASETQTVASMWGRLLRRAIRFEGRHPEAAAPIIDELSARWAQNFCEVDAVVRAQSPLDRLTNAVRAANYRRLLAWRAFQARRRWNWQA